MRRDGLLVPFATFDTRRWTSTWPAPQFQLEIPINLQSVPKIWWGGMGPLSEWQLWLPGSAMPRTVRVSQPDWVPTHCLRQIALKSDYRSDRPVTPLTEQPYPKDGLAVAPPQALEPIEVVPAGGAAAETLAGGLREKFNEAELEVDRRFGHPISRKAREPQAPVIEALYAFGERPRTFYIEASRSYSGSGEKQCRIAFATGWFIRDGESMKWLDMNDSRDPSVPPRIGRIRGSSPARRMASRACSATVGCWSSISRMSPSIASRLRSRENDQA